MLNKDRIIKLVKLVKLVKIIIIELDMPNIKKI